MELQKLKIILGLKILGLTGIGLQIKRCMRHLFQSQYIKINSICLKYR